MKQILLLILISVSIQSTAQINATTEFGDNVVLYEDGTWSFAPVTTMPEAHIFATPSFQGQLSGKSSKKKLLKQSSMKPNNITDDEKWFDEINVIKPVYVEANQRTGSFGNVPENIPDSYDGLPRKGGFYSDSHSFYVYGSNHTSLRYLAIQRMSDDSLIHLLDFKNFMMNENYKPEDIAYIKQPITWADVQDSILYVSHGHRTYAASSGGENAYITAINLNTYEILWRSNPLVSNSRNFLVHEGKIITGYGFSLEKDYLIVLDAQTGAEVQRLLLKTGPDYIYMKDKTVFVRCYDTDYTFTWLD